jgi:putative SOS response-associated peptidase YedK
VLSLLRPAPDGSIEAWPVSSAVGRVANDGPELIERADPAPNSA